MAVTPHDAQDVAASERLPGPLPPRTRLWLDFVNTDAAAQSPGGDLLRDFEALLTWLQQQDAVDEERAGGIRRRAVLQPAAAAATLVDARRVRAALRALSERGEQVARVRDDAVVEINRVLGRSAGTRRIDPQIDGSYSRSFVPTGDAFAGLMIPIVESAAESLVDQELSRIRRCADPRCHRVFLDATKNGLRRWCDMGTCGNRAKAARHRARSAGAR
ncbi:MAG TPA: CGNR zinc finger domain-containing protein [Gemmatimonas sp.]|uniref:CGNR zinc finger domain-containing protein n=1 Tax=Gemmatimonas sp. TaxID=1962908 RepID=UPI002EDB52D7